VRRWPVIVTGVGEAPRSEAAAALLAVEAASAEGSALLLELDPPRPRRPAVLAATGARELEELLARLVPEASPAARGRLCCVALPGGEAGLAAAGVALREAGEDVPSVLWARGETFRDAVEDPGLAPAGVLLRADLQRDRALSALLVRDLLGRGLAVRVAKRTPDRFASWRALAGMSAGGDTFVPGRQLLGRLRGEAAQALPAALGAIAILMVVVLALVSLAGALTGKSRAQRGVDLVAISAVRSLRDDLPRLLAPARLPGGALNSQHINKATYLARARTAAEASARANGIEPALLRLTFPDRGSFAPVQARATVLVGVDRAGVRERAEPLAGDGGGHVLSGEEARVTALAEAAAPASSAAAGAPAYATGGGYSGPLVYRDGEGMRPDVGSAFDEMSRAAAADGIIITVVSGFRSDAEQALLFAAHPDPTWVAPPGHSLHRCATELDLGPSGAYSWLAANAPRFGFVQRYSWEAWHFGFDAGPPPCSAVGDRVLGGGSDGSTEGTDALPAFVPSAYRDALVRSAGRWNVSAALLAAQLEAESGFDPAAVSPAGAEGIAQFTPSTAAAYGLTDPFDADLAIDAQAHLMSDLLKQFGSPALALAAYNAGPGAVQACGCIPAIPETTAYVARILALLGGAGGIAPPALEVRLIE